MRLLKSLEKKIKGTIVKVRLNKESYERLNHALAGTGMSVKQGLLVALQIYEVLDQGKGAINVVYENVYPPYQRDIILPNDFDEKLFVLNGGNDYRVTFDFKGSYDRLQQLTREGITPENVVQRALGTYTTFLEKMAEGYSVKGKWTDDKIATFPQGNEFLFLSF